MELEETFGLFLEGCFSSSFKGKLISSSNLKNILKWLKWSMPLVVLYVINIFLACVFGFTFYIGLLWQRIQHIVWGIVTLTSLLSLTQ